MIDQTLRFARLKNAILKIKQIKYKTKRSTTSVKKMKSILEKNVHDRSSNLLRIIKQKEKLLLKIDTRLNDFTKIMKKMIVNINVNSSKLVTSDVVSMTTSMLELMMKLIFYL